MPTDDDSQILPPMMNDRSRPQANRTLLGVLLAVLSIAILLALWFLIFDRGDSSASGPDLSALPTPVTIPASTPAPNVGSSVIAGDGAVGAETTVVPQVTTTPIPEGFETCTVADAPLTTTTYIVDTNTTPLNQRAEPAVGAPQAGTFEPGEAGLVFTGECVVNITDGYTWWQIFNGTDDVWIASDFVTPN